MYVKQTWEVGFINVFLLILHLLWALLALLEALLGELEDLGAGLAAITGGRGGDILLLDSSLESVCCVLQHSFPVCTGDRLVGSTWDTDWTVLLTPLGQLLQVNTVGRRNQKALKHSKPPPLLLVFWPLQWNSCSPSAPPHDSYRPKTKLWRKSCVKM